MKKKVNKINILGSIKTKSKNRRVNLFVVELGGSKGIIVETKRLVDFKTREIVKTGNSYSVETAIILAEVLGQLLKENKVNNKILKDELEDIKQNLTVYMTSSF